MLIRVERHIANNNKKFDSLCFLSKNLYNYCNYLIRQEFIINGKMLDEYKMTGYLAQTNQVDYKSLPAQTSQQVIKLLFKNWKSFFKAIKEWKKHPKKFNGRPKLPKYKDKVNGRNIVVFTNQQCKVKKGYICFPTIAKIEPLKTKVKKLKEIRIIPQASCYVIEVVYGKNKKHPKLNKTKYASIDLGINNLATLVVNSVKHKPLLINGRILKSQNQFYNKKKALLQSYVGDRMTSKRLKVLTLKRQCKVQDYLHKTSRLIINYCLKNKIGNIVVGYNQGWKQNVNIGKVNNQKFVSIPYAILLQQIEYKAEEVGIKVQRVNESHTSKCDACALEKIGHHEKYAGKRIKRGLFQSSKQCLINADVNGSINILRKVIGNSFVKKIVDRGIADMPMRITPYEYSF